LGESLSAPTGRGITAIGDSVRPRCLTPIRVLPRVPGFSPQAMYRHTGGGARKEDMREESQVDDVHAFRLVVKPERRMQHA